MCWLFVHFVNLINALSVEYIKKCSIRYYYSSPTCFSHSCDQNHVAYDKNIVNIQISVQKYIIRPLGGTFDLESKCNIIYFLNNYLCINYFLGVSHSDVGQNSDRNMLMKNNNVWLDILINVYLLVYHISNSCGLQQDRLLINNYSKHVHWIFIKGLSCAEVCLHAVARSHALIAPTAGLTPALWSSWLQVSQCCLCSRLAWHAQWDARQRAGQLAAPSWTIALLAQSGPDAASC